MVRNQFIHEKLSIKLTDKLLDTDMDGLFESLLPFQAIQYHYPSSHDSMQRFQYPSYLFVSIYNEIQKFHHQALKVTFIKKYWFNNHFDSD